MQDRRSLSNLRRGSGPHPAAQRHTAIVNVETRTPAAFQTSFKAYPFTLHTGKVPINHCKLYRGSRGANRQREIQSGGLKPRWRSAGEVLESNSTQTLGCLLEFPRLYVDKKWQTAPTWTQPRGRAPAWPSFPARTALKNAFDLRPASRSPKITSRVHSCSVLLGVGARGLAVHWL